MANRKNRKLLADALLRGVANGGGSSRIVRGTMVRRRGGLRSDLLARALRGADMNILGDWSAQHADPGMGQMPGIGQHIPRMASSNFLPVGLPVKLPTVGLPGTGTGYGADPVISLPDWQGGGYIGYKPKF